MFTVRSSGDIIKMLNDISELDEKIGHDFGWCEVHGLEGGSYPCNITECGHRAAEVFDEGLELAQIAFERKQDIYTCVINDTAFYFVGPLDKLLESLGAILESSKAEVHRLSKQSETKKSKKKCPHCGSKIKT